MADNNDFKNQVNTRGQHYMQATVEGNCALDVSYYDDRVKLSFSPELPENERQDRRLYDYKHPIMTSLTRVKAMELCNIYKTIIRPAIEKGEDAKGGVVIADVNLLQIESTVVDGVPRPVIKLFKGLDETLTTSSIYKYEFNTTEYILGYEESTGKYTDKVVTYSEVELFFNDLEASVSATSNAFIHTDRVVNKYWKDKLDANIISIGTANGLDLTYKAKSNGNGGRGSIFDTATRNEPIVSTEVISSMDDIDAALNKLN